MMNLKVVYNFNNSLLLPLQHLNEHIERKGEIFQRLEIHTVVFRPLSSSSLIDCAVQALQLEALASIMQKCPSLTELGLVLVVLCFA